MVIVMGSFEVEPDQREAFLAGRKDAMRGVRAEPGCLEYVMSPDPIDPGRVVLAERWADKESFDGHIAAIRAAPRPPSDGVTPKSATVNAYDASGERSLMG